MSLKKNQIAEMLTKNLAKTGDQISKEDASVKSILNRFRQSQTKAENSQESPSPVDSVVTQIQVDSVESARPQNTENATQANFATQANLSLPPRQIAEEANFATQANFARQVIIPEARGELRIPNTIMDHLLPLLDPTAGMLYLRLYRLSHGYRRDTCTVGRDKLSKVLNTSSRTVFRAIDTLEKLGLIERLGTQFGGELKGNTFKVNLPQTLSQDPPSEPATQAKFATMANFTTQAIIATNKEHDDHDLKINHHQKTVMTIYQTLTGKKWGKSDTAHYQKIAHYSVEQLEIWMTLIHNRTSKPIGSFAYFASAIEKEMAIPAQESRASIKKNLEKIVSEIRDLHIGENDFKLSDLAYETKMRCIREGITWNDDVFNEITH